MRPIKLTLCAFGPFSGTEVIEFERLGENPLFLINGPTGSGKTTILDGICFALYGKTTGDEREAAQMRCDIAAPDLLSYVELVFSLGDKIWRIRREPEQSRPKSKGEGLTSHHPRAELYSRDDSGRESVLVASKVTEARAAIEDLTGLNVDQFRQVMVLPQGEFRNLLMANSSEREKVFSHLFQTQIYARIELALKDQAVVLRKELEASRNQQLGVLRSAAVENEAQLLSELSIQAEQLHETTTCRVKAAKKQKQAARALINAQKVSTEFERLNRAKATLEDLLGQNTKIEELGKRLNDARLVLRLQPDFNQWQAAVKLREQSGVKLAESRARLDHCQHRSLRAHDKLQRLITREPEMDSVQQRKRDLEAYRNRVGQFEDAGISLKKSEQTLANSRTQLARCQARVQKKQLHLDEHKKRNQQAQDRLKGMADQQLELHRLSEIYQQRAEAEQTGHKLHACRRELQVLVSARDDALQQRETSDQAVIRLEMAWHAGQAVVLAEKLKKDQACPVCGSQHHPEPAQTTLEIPGEAQREAAALHLRESVEALRKLDTEIAVQEARKTQLQELNQVQQTALGEAFDLALSVSLEARNIQQSKVQSLQKEQQIQQQTAEQLQILANDLAELEADLKNADQSQAEANTQYKVASSQMHQAETELPEAYRISGKLESHISELGEQLTAYREHKVSATQAANASDLASSKAEADQDNAMQQFENTQGAETESEQQWQQSISDSTLQNEQGFHHARMNDGQMLELDERIKQYARDLDQSKGAINSLEEVLLNQEKPDLELFQHKAGVADTAYAEADAVYIEIDKRHSRLQEIARNLAEVKQLAQALENKYAVIGTLADTANGKTGNRISLQRFVLSVLLDDVLIEASQRFKRMSKGRYVLYRQQEKAKGAGASGLELVVDDAYSGRQRPVATLSGGESFMAALSLALGLSDVVQAYAGGIKLDTLFIDEGFGSLDQESLDLAVNTLIDLQSSGRMVGVISHVPELKERINVRLDVITDRSGSHTQIVV